MNDCAIFLEMGGIFIKDSRCGADLAKPCLMPGAAKALASLRAGGFRLFVVSNQPGVARGLFSEAALAPVVRRIEELLAAEGAALDGFYYCPHHPEGRVRVYSMECLCRKPSPGLIEDACRDHELDSLRSWMIGNALDDVEAGLRAGCRTVMIENRHGRSGPRGPNHTPHLTAPNLAKAAELVLRDRGWPAANAFSTEEQSLYVGG